MVSRRQVVRDESGVRFFGDSPLSTDSDGILLEGPTCGRESHRSRHRIVLADYVALVAGRESTRFTQLCRHDLSVGRRGGHPHSYTQRLLIPRGGGAGGDCEERGQVGAAGVWGRDNHGVPVNGFLRRGSVNNRHSSEWAATSWQRYDRTGTTSTTSGWHLVQCGFYVSPPHPLHFDNSRHCEAIHDVAAWHPAQSLSKLAE
uniref:Transposase n=1 Tax=Mesocestoides corti TaxID=53468 RepID=A0A5K3FLW5_MESCO